MITFGLVAQELPPIQNFTPQDYDGENQNWAITQGSDNHIYVANNHSLLDFNGAVWNKYDSPNNSIIRSVHAQNDFVFTGQYMEFGFWQRDVFGKLKYSSISSQFDKPMIEDEEFWNILTLGGWVLFQSLDRIYSYNIATKQFKIIEAKSIKAQIFKVNDTVYFQNQNKGLYKIENGEPVLIIDHDVLKNRNVVGMYEEDSTLIVILNKAQFLKHKNSKTSIWKIEAQNFLNNIDVYVTERLNDGSFILGTISNGMYQISGDGNLVRIINQQKGLNNNTVLSTFQDKDENLWLGLDNGISVLNINSPFQEYIDNTGRLGLVYASIFFGGNLYLGTNQGLFATDVNQEAVFKLLEGTEGQVWSLQVIDETLFCGHNKGTYIVEKDTAELISSFPGTWNIKKIEDKPDLLLQGNFNGLSVLKKENGNWNFRNRIKGFDISSRFFEITGPHEILVNHELKGLYSLKIDENYEKVLNIKTHPQMGYSSSVVNYEEKLIYTTENGAFVKATDSLKFKSDTIMTNLLFGKAGGITSIVLPDIESNRLWYFTKSGLSMVSPTTFNASMEITTIPVSSFFKRSLGVAGFENLTKISRNNYLLGISNGFVTLDLNKRKEDNYSIEITEVSNQKNLEATSTIPLLVAPELNYEKNSVSFFYAVPEYEKYKEVFYQYRLKGLFENWSSWHSEPNTSLNNLRYGTYIFEVRAKVGNTMTNNTATYAFTINRPWYLSFVAIILYIISIITLLFGIHRLYKGYYTQKQNRLLEAEKRKLKRKKLKTEKELVQIKNEKLKGEIESKNRELAVSTMSIIKKNEFLHTIKNQLQKAENPTQLKSVIKTIDRNINNEDDWKFFEEAFNNADKDFLKKVKELHPELTSNDLRLCAYLRLNLSSKEIAPLLNISVKSVEVKRYRLRKKMDLPRENSLNEYLISV